MSLRLMLFDLWGTLLLDDPDVTYMRDRLRTSMASGVLSSLGMAYEEARIESAFIAAGAELMNIHADGLDITAEARTILYLRHLDESIAERLDEDGWRRMHEAVLTPALQRPPSPIDGALDALAEVKSLGVSVGLISNAGATPGFVLSALMERYGMLQYFDHTVFSDEVELSKPSPAIFAHALDLFGVEPGEAAFVGDMPVLDVLGPRAAGLWSVQVGDITDDGIEPHARIATIDGLVPALSALGLLDDG